MVRFVLGSRKTVLLFMSPARITFEQPVPNSSRNKTARKGDAASDRGIKSFQPPQHSASVAAMGWLPLLSFSFDGRRRRGASGTHQAGQVPCLTSSGLAPILHPVR